MMQFSKSVENMQPSDIREIGKLTADPEVISFAGGMPDPEFFPIEALRKVSDLVLQEDGKAALQYNATAGYLPLREKIATRMTNMGMQVSAESIILTSGSQQGIDFCGKVFLNEGDAIICESPSYSGALNAFSAYLPEFIEIPTDDQGMDMAALEKVMASKSSVKFIYVIPDFQNPTGRSWSLERRQKLIALANKYDVPVIEDDPYSSFRFEGDRLPTLKSLDTENRVIYLGTFSKMLCPGLRVGWIAGGIEVLSKIEIIKQVADIHSNSLTQREVAKYLELYNLDDQIKGVTKAYKKRRDIMVDAMKEFFPSECAHTKPEGGIFIWIDLPESLNAREILLEAVKEKVAFIPGGGFFPNSKKENTIRLSFATMPDEKIKEGVKRLGKVLKKALTK